MLLTIFLFTECMLLYLKIYTLIPAVWGLAGI